MKYDFTLDMVSENSCSNILRVVRPGTKVLEFGPAHGRMTKYLKESLDCRVCIIEIDKEAGKEASKFASRSFVGPDDGGDAEHELWSYRLKTYNELFDHIIFADVLEHLNNPWSVLERAKDFLHINGTILISIPNVSHNSVIIDLINDNFEYRPTGLLDNTHIRFFTQKTLLKMVDSAGLMVTKEMNTHCAVEHTEFRNSLENVPGNVSRFLKKRTNGDVYQFVWELKKVQNG